MNMNRTKKRRGSLMLEFALVGIPTIFLTVSSIETAMAMWQYHTLEECAAAGARAVITHGADCAGSCTVTVGNVITKVVTTGVGLDDTKLTIKLVSASTSPTGTTYSPARSYLSNSTTFPPTADAVVGDDITVTVSYKVTNPFVMYWPGAGLVTDGSYTLGATSRQRILF
jgi:Flp pilus assembly protein TadG